MSIGFLGSLVITVIFMIMMILSSLIPMIVGGTIADFAGVNEADIEKLLLSLSFLIPTAVILSIWKIIGSAQNKKRRETSTGQKQIDTNLRIDPSAPSDFWKSPLNYVIFFVILTGSIIIVAGEIGNLAREILQQYSMAEVLAEIMLPTNHHLDLAGAILTIVIIGPLCEEILFRGILQKGLLNHGFSIHFAIIWQGVLFGLIHIFPYQISYAIVIGILLGYIRLWTGRLSVTFIIHALNNLVSVISLYFLMSPEEIKNMDIISAPPALTLAAVFALLALGYREQRKLKKSLQ